MSLLISFHEDKYQNARKYILSLFKQQLGLKTANDLERLHNVQVTCTTPDLLEREADRLNILKYNTKGFLQEYEINIPKKNFIVNEKDELFTVSQRNFLLLSVLEQLTTTKEFLSELKADGIDTKEISDIHEGEELLDTCTQLGVIESIFPVHTDNPEEYNKLFKRIIYSLPCNSKGNFETINK